MDLRTVSPEPAVSPQIAVADLGIAAARVCRAIICNRADGEGDGQTPMALIAQVARDHGLAQKAIPVISGQLPGPVLAC